MYDLRLGARTNHFKAQTLVAELAVEAFRDATLPRFAGLDQRRADALRTSSTATSRVVTKAFALNMAFHYWHPF
jgi:hypothetical protein